MSYDRPAAADQQGTVSSRKSSGISTSDFNFDSHRQNGGSACLARKERERGRKKRLNDRDHSDKTDLTATVDDREQHRFLGFQSKSLRAASQLTYLNPLVAANSGLFRYFFGFFFAFFFAFGTEITCRSSVAIAGLTLPTATKLCQRGLLVRAS